MKVASDWQGKSVQGITRVSGALLFAPVLGAVLAPTAYAQTPTAPPPANPPAVVANAPSSGLPLATRRAAFNAVWNKVNEQFFDPTFGGVDWKAVKKKYAPLADKAESDREFYDVLERMVGELKASHFAILPPQAYGIASPTNAATPSTTTSKPAKPATTKPEPAIPALPDTGKPRSKDRGASGITVGFIGGQAVAIRVVADSPAQKAGIVPGDVIEAVDGVKVAAVSEAIRASSAVSPADKPIYERMYAQVLVDGRANDKLAFTIKGKDDQTREVPVTVGAATVRDALPGLPPMPTQVDSRRIALNGSSEADGYVGYLHFTPFTSTTLGEIRTVLNGMADAKGIIVDVRGNPGGLAPVTWAIASQLTDKKSSLGTMAMRSGKMNFPVLPQGIKYTGPLVILTDELSMSCSEILAGGLQAMNRARVIGRATPGKVLPSTTLILPGGARLQYAFADFKTTKGVLLEGRGVKPDASVELSRERLYKEGDPDIEAALQTIRQTAQPKK